MKTATLIRLEDEQLAALDALAAQHGKSLAALIRWCVQDALPRLTRKLVSEAGRSNEPTIGTNVPLTPDKA